MTKLELWATERAWAVFLWSVLLVAVLTIWGL